MVGEGLEPNPRCSSWKRVGASLEDSAARIPHSMAKSEQTIGETDQIVKLPTG